MDSETPFYIETQASSYATFYTESPKAEARNTFVFCLWALIILNTFFNFCKIFWNFILQIGSFSLGKKLIYIGFYLPRVFLSVFKSPSISLIFPHMIEKIRTEVCSTHTHVYTSWSRFSKQKTASGLETENFCTYSVAKSSRKSCIALTRGIKIKRPLRDLYSNVKRNAFSLFVYGISLDSTN